MKLRHAAPVALVGWFMITPPLQTNGHHDTSAPLSEWKIEGGAGSHEQCEQARTMLGERAARQGRASDIEAVKTARCVPQDDPALQGKGGQ